MASDSLLVWMSTRDSYVESQGTTTLRIKHASKLGRNVMDFRDTAGDLVSLDLPRLKHLKPVVVEIIGSRNPLDDLLKKLDAISCEEVGLIFESVRSVIIHEASCSAATICDFLRRLTIASSFSISGVDYTAAEWDNVGKALQRLNVRCLSAGCGPVCSLARTLNVEMLHLAGQPGVSLAELTNCTTPLVTVKTLFASEIDFENASEGAAEKLLEVIPSLFPRLESLIFDWNMVDPALTFDAQAKKIVDAIIALKSKIPLSMVAVIAYTPCGATKHAAGELARSLSPDFHQVSLVTFATRGVPVDNHNFSLVLGGESSDARTTLTHLIVQRRSSIITAGQSMLLIDAESNLHQSGSLVDFGGFDAKYIQKEIEAKDKEFAQQTYE
ncbi:hypothetical protein PFISCL1PPCAC_11036 [Pristionchus fissidentatus]|uniref:Uncharacterized protein n=1 Tax=Pristionchus fissidentatus TaxID=1538716 RepID=A0AAV5VMW5_9BILA|nr:hypothetical protein PFISCL1PPCAC_11036 [Pristionchus fissidentatus]